MRVVPVLRIDGRIAEVTSNYGQLRGTRRHLGEDWLFRRVPADMPFAAGNPRGSKGYYVPKGAKATPPYPGIVQYSNRQESGIVIRVRHEWFDTLYLHIRDSYVSPGQSVSPGDALGEIGGDPRVGRSSPFGADPFYPQDRYGIVHLHFESRGFDNEPFDPRLMSERVGELPSSPPSHSTIADFDIVGTDTAGRFIKAGGLAMGAAAIGLALLIA